MKITLVYRHYWPDTPPLGLMLRDITQWLVQAGHEVEVITAQPSYKPDAKIPKQPRREIIAGVSIRRVALFPEKGPGAVKIINTALFLFCAFLICLFGKKRDLVWAGTTPPVVQAFILSLAAKIRRATFLYQMQDIYPEIAMVSGEISRLFPVKLFRWMDGFTLKNAAAVTVLSDDMANAIKARGINTANVSLINNFTLVNNDAEHETYRPKLKKGEPAVFVFAGNVGRFQNLTAVLEAFRLVDPKEAVLRIIGEGRAKSELKDFAEKYKMQNVVFENYMPSDTVFKEMQLCHIGLVSLAPNIVRYAFPSKVLTYMAADLPMLALVEDDSSLAKLLAERNIGMNVDWSRGAEEMAAKIRLLALQSRTNRMRPAQETDIYHQTAARDKWLSLFDKFK